MLHSSSRRRLMFKAAGAAALLPAGLASLRQFSAALAEEPSADESYWMKVRRQFAFRDEKTPMNAANLCPTPRMVAERIAELTRDIDVDCSFNNRNKFTKLLESSREKVAKQLGVSADEIALVRNTSEANNVINNGLKLKPRDEIVLWDQNHPTNNVAWKVRAARFGLTVKPVSTPQAPTAIEELLDVFVNAFSPKTRVLAITHVSNISGQRLPVRELCQAAHKRGIYVHVDGAQTWGAFDVNLRDLGCDSYAASAHKWFVGPKEVGLLYVKSNRIAEIWPNIVAPGWGGDIEPDVRGARKFESLGQRDDAALATIGDTADFHRAIGGKRIQQRIEQLAGMLKTQLRDAGFKLVTPLESRSSGGVCIIDAIPNRRGDVVNKLYEKYGIAGSTAGGLRLCPHIYNTTEHIDRAVRGIKAMRDLIG